MLYVEGKNVLKEVFSDAKRHRLLNCKVLVLIQLHVQIRISFKAAIYLHACFSKALLALLTIFSKGF